MVFVGDSRRLATALEGDCGGPVQWPTPRVLAVTLVLTNTLRSDGPSNAEGAAVMTTTTTSAGETERDRHRAVSVTDRSAGAPANDDRTLAVVVVRAGELPVGAVQCASLARGRVLIAGTGTAAAFDELIEAGVASSGIGLEADPNDRIGIARIVASRFSEFPMLLFPCTPDGRDLAPLVAAEMARPMIPNCVSVSTDSVTAVRGGRAMVSITVTSPVVCTVQAGGSSDAAQLDAVGAPSFEVLDTAVGGTATGSNGAADRTDAVQTLAIHPPDSSTIDLVEARRIIGVGDGAGGAAGLATIEAVAPALGCAVGATRVVTDAGLLGHDRQIGTTGVVVAPELYIAFGVSGAIQHTAGLGDPDHVISVNTDPHCPMMHMADLAIVADAEATAQALLGLMGADGGAAAGGVGGGATAHG